MSILNKSSQLQKYGNFILTAVVIMLQVVKLVDLTAVVVILLVVKCRTGIVHCHMDDGWMIYDFTSFSTVFQSYQDDDRLIMKGCLQWNPIYS